MDLATLRDQVCSQIEGNAEKENACTAFLIPNPSIDIGPSGLVELQNASAQTRVQAINPIADFLSMSVQLFPRCREVLAKPVNASPQLVHGIFVPMIGVNSKASGC